MSAVFLIESEQNVILIHNQSVKAKAKGKTVVQPTFAFGPGNDQPTILQSGTTNKTTLEVVAPKAAGRTVNFSTTGGTLNVASATIGADGIAKVELTASADLKTVLVKAEVPGTTLSQSIYIYHASYNFLNLSANADVGNYNDATFVDTNSLTKDQIQAFLVAKGSFLKAFSENGKPASQIIKDAAVASGINPKIILVTLQKEQGLISQTTPLPPDSRRMKNAMGAGNGAENSNFTSQVNVGSATFKNLFITPTFLKVKQPQKFNDQKALRPLWLYQNHLCAVPEKKTKEQSDITCEAVSFKPINKSTFAQHKYTNYVVAQYTLSGSPAGGVYAFYAIWKSYFKP